VCVCVCVCVCACMCVHACVCVCAESLFLVVSSLKWLICEHFSSVSLAEEFEQLDDENQGDSPPVVLHLPQSNDETSLDQSPVHLSQQDNGLLTVGVQSTSWSPLVNQSPLQSPSGSNSHEPSPTPYLESSDSSRESPIPKLHDKLYRTHDQKQKPIRSHDQQGRSHDQQSRSHDKQGRSHDQLSKSHDQKGSSHDEQHGSNDEQYGSNDEQHGSHGQHYHVVYRAHDPSERSLNMPPITSNQLYTTPESFSCPNLSSLQTYGNEHGNTDDSMSAIWDDHHHDNCASMDSIHIRSLSGQQHTPLARRSTIITTTLPAVTEEVTPSPPSHVYKVMMCVASLYIMLI